MGPSNVADTTRSLPSVFWPKDVSLEPGATAGGVGGGAGGLCGLLDGGGSLGPIATTRGPLTREKDLPCRVAETSRPVVWLICSDRSPAVAVIVSPDSTAAGFARPTDFSTCSRSTCSNRCARSFAGQT